jgi:hypothetical protein
MRATRDSQASSARRFWSLAIPLWTVLLLGLLAFGISLWYRMTAGPRMPVPHGHSATQGSGKSPKSTILETGAEMLQSKGPLKSIHAHVCGFHFYAGEPRRQVRAHHYCSHQNEEVLQCVIYDSDGPGARLIGVEYIISEKLFNGLAGDEKKLWHSHQFEVMSGQLVAPGLPEAAETELMEKIVSTYGKTWHTWQVDKGDSLPLGLPKLMMGFTADGQINPALLTERDQQFDVMTSSKRLEREKSIVPAPVAKGADSWQTGVSFQIQDTWLK